MYSVSQRFEQFFKKIFSKSKKSADERHIFDPWIWIYFGGPDFPNCAVSLSTNNTHYIWLKFWTTKGVLDHFYRKKPHTDVVKLLWEVARTGLLCQFSYLQTLGGFFYHKKTRLDFFRFRNMNSYTPNRISFGNPSFKSNVFVSINNLSIQFHKIAITQAFLKR